ncbi:uncharacterized protein LOC142334300 isoform X2 [Lycorma delicatula]|uniref:uncharacterized protein LOC142334300 isoform X2 n=1 Tax=Lycorma delicatula TaxID=130591 RepID=UPI003F513580
MGGRLLVLTACLSWWLVLCRCQIQYVKWRPVDVVARLVVAKIDPVDAYHALEAVKNKPVGGALQMVQNLQTNVEHLYEVLRSMKIDPFDAYSALQLWISEHSSEETTSTEVLEEIQKLLNKIIKAFKDSAFKELVDEAKELASVINNPEKLFQDFFGYDKTFQAFKRFNPGAFEAVKSILFGKSSPQPSHVSQPVSAAPPAQQNAGESVQHTQQHQNVQLPVQQTQQHQNVQLHQHIQNVQPQVGLNEPDLQDPQFADTTRYNRILDETHVFHKGPNDPPETPRQTVHNIRRYYDNQTKVVIESLKTIEFHDSGLKNVRKNFRTLDNNVANNAK